MKFLRRTLFIRWGVSLVVTALIFSLAQPSFAQILEADATLAQFVAANDVLAGSEIGSNGFRQIYYDLNGDKTFITDSSYTNADPVTDREYIAWMGQVDGSWSIFLYHIPTGTTTELSNPSNNVNPRLSQGKVVWEGWVKDRWQVFLFSGTSIRQVTQGNLSLNPDIEGDDIIYARKNAQGEWSAFRHSLGTDEVTTIKQGRAAKKPVFRNGLLVFPIEEDIKREEARKQAGEEARRLAEEAARLAEEAALAQEANLLEAPLEDPAQEEPVEPGESTTTETVAEEPVLPTEPTEPETVTEEEIIAELEEEPAPEEPVEPQEPAQEEPVLPTEPTEPETVTEEEIIAELEGEPLAEEPAPAPEPTPASEPTPEPELPPPASPAPEPTPEPSPPPEA